MKNYNNLYNVFFKRVIDFLLATCAILILSPLIVILAVIVKIKLGSPIIFKQQRPGLNEKVFWMYKFRTMTDEKNSEGELLPDDMRLTKLGKFLRATSLDELPELINIIKGDMSIVGPRPQLIRDMTFMDAKQRKRHTVLPGLTGWAQVNGRNGITWEEKLLLDLEYIQEISFINDLKIILLTLKQVIIRDGISAEGMETAEDYGDYLLRKKLISEVKYSECIKESKKIVAETLNQ